MKRRFLFFCWLYSLNPCSAQDSGLSGLLLDQSQNPIANATIQLLKSESTPTSTAQLGTVSDQSGKFALEKLPPGRYFVEISHVNFATHFFDLNLLPGEQQKLDTIILEAQLYHLQEITVRGKKLSMQQSSDKISVLVEANVLGTGGTVLDILKQIPTVSINLDGVVSIRGIMNGKDFLSLIRKYGEIITQKTACYNPMPFMPCFKRPKGICGSALTAATKNSIS